MREGGEELAGWVIGWGVDIVFVGSGVCVDIEEGLWGLDQKRGEE